MNKGSSEELDELIEKFVISPEKEINMLKEMLENLSYYVRIHSDGEIEFIVRNLTSKDSIFLILLTRFVADKINKLKGREVVKNVSSDTRVEEIARIIGKEPKVVSARLSDLEKEGFVERTGKGTYAILSLNRAMAYLEKIQHKVRKDEK